VSDKLLVSSRKGLFTAIRSGGRWEISAVNFLGDNVTLTLSDPRDGRHYAALDHGHFGVKLHRSNGNGWEEIAVPVYPPKPEGYEEKDMWGRPIDWSTARIWALAASNADEPGVIWCGTLPGGLFRSTDHGKSWQMVRSLWDHPKRKQWAGGGAELPGIHSICIDPRNSKRVWVAVSTGGIWFTEDSGESWTLRGDGMRAEYMPPEQSRDPIAQDVHCLAQCPAAPHRMWVQHHNGIFVSSDEGKTFSEITASNHLYLDSRSSCIRANPTRRGSCPRSRMRNECRAVGSSSSRAPATAAGLSIFSARACRNHTLMTSCIGTRSRSTRPGNGLHSGLRPAAFG
jgi:hypothetical protein